MNNPSEKFILLKKVIKRIAVVVGLVVALAVIYVGAVLYNDYKRFQLTLPPKTTSLNLNETDIAAIKDTIRKAEENWGRGVTNKERELFERAIRDLYAEGAVQKIMQDQWIEVPRAEYVLTDINFLDIQRSQKLTDRIFVKADVFYFERMPDEKEKSDIMTVSMIYILKKYDRWRIEKGNSLVSINDWDSKINDFIEELKEGK